jgi:hypothetical protein
MNNNNILIFSFIFLPNILLSLWFLILTLILSHRFYFILFKKKKSVSYVAFLFLLNAL